MENNSNPFNNTINNVGTAPQPQSPIQQPIQQPQVPLQPHPMQAGVKSATTAGLLGIFLGAFGGHNWYLGENKKGIIHVAIAGAGLLINFIGGVIMPRSMSILDLYRMGGLLAAMTAIGGIMIAASEVWGFVEGIQILTQGDAGLAAKGYPVATPVVYPSAPMPQQPVVPQSPTQPVAPVQPTIPQQTAPAAPPATPPQATTTPDNNIANNQNGVNNG